MLFRKKPVIIDAFQWEGGISFETYPSWFRQKYKDGGCWFTANGQQKTLTIKTLEGEMVASVGDMIIQGVKGEIYPCKPDIFDATYERVSETGP